MFTSYAPAETAAEADRATYAARIAAEVEHVESVLGLDIWDSGKLRRAGLRRDISDAFRGPWRTVRPYVTTEWREHVEEGRGWRQTWAEWQTARRDERAAEAASRAGKDEPLASLEWLRDGLAARAALIVTARERGATWAEIVEASGLSRAQAAAIAAELARSAVREAETARLAADDEPF